MSELYCGKLRLVVLEPYTGKQQNFYRLLHPSFLDAFLDESNGGIESHIIFAEDEDASLLICDDGKAHDMILEFYGRAILQANLAITVKIEPDI